MKNLAFIDGQNLHLGVKEEGWKIDLKRFRIYLKDKYKVSDAYYFLGHIQDDAGPQKLYEQIQRAGFILLFKDHTSIMLGTKKGNVDTDIVFNMMRNLIDNKDFEKIVLVSGDGDYRRTVEYLIEKNRFLKMLFPNKRFASSLYKSLTALYFDYLSLPEVKHKIEYKKYK